MFSFPPCCRTQDTSLYSNMQDPISLESGERMGITKGTLTWMEQGRTTPSAPGVTASPRKALQEIYREILHKNTAASPGDHTQEVQSKERGRNASCPCSCRLHRAQVPWSKFAPRAASFSPPLFLHDATGIILLVKRCTSSLELLLLENSISCPGNAAQWSTGAWISPEFKAVQKTHRNPGLSSENHLFFVPSWICWWLEGGMWWACVSWSAGNFTILKTIKRLISKTASPQNKVNESPLLFTTGFLSTSRYFLRDVPRIYYFLNGSASFLLKM